VPKYRPPAAVPGRAQPTGCLASAGTVRALCQVAAEHDLVIISDEIYRDLTYETVAPVPSPALIAPARTVVTTALSKNLAVGGWRIGVARLPAGPAGDGLRDRLVGIGSEIWSAPSAPGQTPPDRYGAGTLPATRSARKSRHCGSAWPPACSAATAKRSKRQP